MTSYRFNDFLESNGYFYDNDLIENYLLSLKVKPFVILSGNSGTGKTKLPQLFSRYLMECADDNAFYKIKVSTLKRSWNYGKSDKQVGWSLFKKYLENVLPINKIDGSYEIEIGGYKTQATFSLLIQLYYDYKNDKFRKYFKELYDQEQLLIEEDKKFNRNHEKQMVDLGVSYESLKNFISNDFDTKNEIILRPTLTKSVTEGNGKVIPFDIFKYMPFNKKIPSTISVNNLFANAHFELKLRMSGYGTDDIKNYLTELYENNESHFELKIRGFEHNYEDFKSFNIKGLNDLNYCVMPVGTDWNDGSHIIGYYNVLSNKYQNTPAYDLIKQAQLNPKNPYFLILDEMNTVPIENYFADFLSSIDSGEEIPLYGNEDTLKLPKNLFIIGTVNDGGDTHKLSSKVLDRVNIIELDFHNFEYISPKSIEKSEFNDINFLEYLLDDFDVSRLDISDLEKILFDISYCGENLWDILTIEISKFAKILYCSNFDFNLGVINEILRFMVVAWRYENSPSEWKNWKKYFDAQIKQRILPKIQGSKNDIEDILIDLLSLCLKDDVNFQDLNSFKIIENICEYYTSALKLQKMHIVLLNQGYVSFIN